MAGTISFSVPTVGGTQGTEDAKTPTALTTLRDALNAVLDSSNNLDGAKLGAATVPNSAIAAAAGIPVSKLNLSGLSGDVTSTSGGVVTATKTNNLAAVYRTILEAESYLIDPAGAGQVAAATYLLGAVTELDGLQSGATEATFVSVAPPRIFHFVAADYAVSGLTTKLNIRAQVLTNATAPAVTYSFALAPVTVAGGINALTYTAGTLVSGSGVNIASPSSSSPTGATTGDFTIPSDGFYMLVVVTGAAMAQSSAVSCHAQLRVRNV